MHLASEGNLLILKIFLTTALFYGMLKCSCNYQTLQTWEKSASKNALWSYESALLVADVCSSMTTSPHAVCEST